ncbi:hypothetical protein TNCV_379911 [Trichonephila clavipes]|nr:hypothetical protein TNCV_379911 [Trichonephila clavipes]
MGLYGLKINERKTSSAGRLLDALKQDSLSQMFFVFSKFTIPSFHDYGNSFKPAKQLFEDPCHRCRLSGELRIARMEWPVYSSELNPIENLWDTFERAVCLHFPPPATLRN